MGCPVSSILSGASQVEIGYALSVTLPMAVNQLQNPILSPNPSVCVCVCVPMAQRGDEIEAAVNAVVHDVPSVQTALVVEIALKLVVDVGDDGAETGGETRSSSH